MPTREATPCLRVVMHVAVAAGLELGRTKSPARVELCPGGVIHRSMVLAAV